MSNLLKEAIVDAQALREAALKNAEAAIVDKYSTEVRETLEQLLEQDEPNLDEDAPAEGDASLEEDVEDVPLAATDGLSEMEGDNLNQLAEEGEDVEVNLDLGALKEALQEMSAPAEYSVPGARDDYDDGDQNLDEEIDEDVEIEEAILAALLEDDDTITIEDPAAQDEAVLDAMEEDIEEGYYPGHSDPNYHPYDDDADIRNDPRNRRRKPATPAKDRNRTKDRYTRRDYERDYQREQFEISDELLDSIVEKLTVDMGADLAGWAGRSAEDKKFQMEKEIAHRRSTDVEEELDTLKKAQEELVFENSQLSEQLDNLKRAAIEMKESLQDVNLSNARLLYTNRVLRNTSLNERQKDRIVEAISKSDSVTEARTIFNTLQSTVESAPNRGPKTLSEAISRPTSVIRASRAESTPKQDAFAERMKRLAGIK